MKKIYLALLSFFTISNLAQAQTWGALNQGIIPGTSFNEEVTAMTSYNGNLVVGGYIENVSGTAANRIAMWNGSSWSAMGSGLSANVKALVVYNGVLYAGLESSTNSVMKWNSGTSTWTTAGGGFNNAVYSLCVDSVNNILYAGGAFTSPGSLVAKYNGTAWSNVANGLNNGNFPAVNKLIIFKNELYAGGGFNPSSSTIKNVAKLNGTSWVKAGNNLPNNLVLCFGVYKDQLYIGGVFNQVGSLTANGVAVLGSTGWTAVSDGVNNGVYDLAYYNGELYATGNFTFDGTAVNSLSRVARWNGTVWADLGSGVDEISKTLWRHRDTLYVGGLFSSAGGVTGTAFIASWYKALIGCNDINFSEYDPDVDIAVSDSCKTARVIGCTDTSYFEYNANATFQIADSCVTLKVYGCTDPAYNEYNPNANINAPGNCLTLVGIKDVVNASARKVALYPNPFENTITITSQSEIKAIIVSDPEGRILSNNLTHKTNTFSQTLDLSGLNAGIYFVKIVSGNSTHNERIIKD